MVDFISLALVGSLIGGMLLTSLFCYKVVPWMHEQWDKEWERQNAKK